MHVISGAGDFDIRITREDHHVVMIGKMGYWETKLILKPGEAFGLAKAMILPLLGALLKL